MSDGNIDRATTTTITAAERHADLFSQGDSLYWKCQYEKANEHFQTVLNQPSISLIELARCYNSIGAANAKLRKYEEALIDYRKQLDILIKLKIPNNEENIVKCYMSIGTVYLLKHDYVRAIEYHKQALNALLKTNSASDLTSNIYKNLANLYSKTKEFDSALIYFEKALAFDRQHLQEDHLKFGQTYADMGAMYYSKLEYRVALNYFVRARETWLKSLPSSHVYIESMEKTIRTVQSKLERHTDNSDVSDWKQKQQHIVMANRRFVDNSLQRLQSSNYNPTSDYEHLSVLSLETAVEHISHLVPGIVDYVSRAKEKCSRDSALLTRDESAAIYLYTMPVSFFSSLNAAFRAANRHVLTSWLAFLKLLITALGKLPPTEATIWRGVNYDATENFIDNSVYTWWCITSCSTDLKIVHEFLGESGTLFAIETAHGKDISKFSAVPDEQEVILMPGTRVRAKSQPARIIDRLFLVHLKEINLQSESNQLFEQIKQEYQRNSRIERFINPAISFPIEQSYINLSIVDTKEQREKEKQLHHAQHATAVIGAYEDIYGVKTAIDVKDIFKICKGHEKKVLVFGRAGIGKSTFCRYIAYQWAMGSYWPEYELLALIPLRRLTTYRYPPHKSYSLIDLVRKELFPLDLTEMEKEQLKKQFDAKKTLWILDGYDEIVQNIPSHMQSLLEQLLKTPHHIITSRPYLNTLSYDVQTEIIGFTDENIKNYIRNFFHQTEDEIDDTPLKSNKLVNFLRSNSSIWGVAHIPVNLELICSLWSNEEWSETNQLTMTRLYTMMTEWLCRRCLRAQDIAIQKISASQMYQRCEKEFQLLESLAFLAMKSNTILIRPVLLEKASDEANVSLEDYSHILNMGILKSFDKHGTNTQIETDKDHYFVHLSFQEYFAARYLNNALKGSQAERSMEFIRHHKYNQRHTLLFSFAAGLLSEQDGKSGLDLFWDTLLGAPVDLVGIRHMQLLIHCMEETNGTSLLSRRSILLKWIAECLKHSFITKNKTIRNYLLQSLQRSQSIACNEAVINVLLDFLQHDDMERKAEVLLFISELKIANPSAALITSVLSRLDHGDETIRENACEALVEMGEKAATNEVINKLVCALKDHSDDIRKCACLALGKIGEKAATNEVISKLVSALDDQSERVRDSACDALGKMGEKAATNEVISKLVSALEDQSEQVRQYAYLALGNIGEKAATDEVINKLVSALEDQSEQVRQYACLALGNIGEKVATDEVISKLVRALEDQSEQVRQYACLALGNIGEKAAKNEVINRLVSALGDQSEQVRQYACLAFGKMGEKAATNEVISKLVSALDDQSEHVRKKACEALGKMGEKGATKKMISKLVWALEDQSEQVRQFACDALGKIGEKAATNEVISKLVCATGDQGRRVSRSALYALKKICEKVAASEVISKLVSMVNSGQLGVYESGEIFENILSSAIVIKQINPKIIAELCLTDDAWYCFKNCSESNLIDIFLETKNVSWLSAVTLLALVKGIAVIAINDKVVVYGKEEPFELLIESPQLAEQLVDAFNDQAERYHLHLEILPKV